MTCFATILNRFLNLYINLEIPYRVRNFAKLFQELREQCWMPLHQATILPESDLRSPKTLHRVCEERTEQVPTAFTDRRQPGDPVGTHAHTPTAQSNCYIFPILAGNKL